MNTCYGEPAHDKVARRNVQCELHSRSTRAAVVVRHGGAVSRDGSFRRGAKHKREENWNEEPQKPYG